MDDYSRPPPRRRGGTRHNDDYDFSNFDRKDVIVDHGTTFDDCGTMRREYAPTVRQKKICITPASLNDEFAQWKPFDDFKIPETLSPDASANDKGSSDDEEEDSDSDEVDEVDGSGKRKRNVKSDNPNILWRAHAEEFLHELYRFDGLGDALLSPCCSTCGAHYLTDPAKTDVSNRLFRCQDCSPLLECTECCLERHKVMPLHRIKEWLGTHYHRASLLDLGLVYQLGHAGLPCLSPEPQIRSMAVLDCNGIHELAFQYCECTLPQRRTTIQQLMRAGWYPATVTDPQTCATFKVLDYYRELNVRANVNINDFIDTLLGLTNPIGMNDKTPNRRRAFSRMVRQWILLHHLKRSGVGMTLRRLDDIPEGCLAVLCWACPQLGMNLPEGWETVDPKFFYLYMPILAIDANFRLRNRIRMNERPDPELAPGSAYFVHPTPYKEHLKKYVSETDISTCIAFAALLEKDTKLTTGLKTSGVVGCACARHEVVRPQGLGDLQKGERYSNVDYVFFSAIRGFQLLYLGVSYDIACQWRRYLLERMEQLPKELHIDKEKVRFAIGLPTWHAAAHDISCRAANALTYQEGLARTDGEGIERIWSVLNTASYATKEMGEGVRHDTIDDRIDHLNFYKNLRLRNILARRLRIAIEERDRQQENFEFNDHQLDPKRRAEWLQRITDWKANRELTSPYLLTGASKGPTEDEVRAELKAQEEAEKKSARRVIRGTSALSFLTAGLELEDIQIKIRRDLKAATTTTHQRTQIEQRRKTFFHKLTPFRELQHIYVPGAVRAIHEDGLRPAPSNFSDNAETTTLWLPSDFPAADRLAACDTIITEQELKLRQARCNDALVAIRHFLHAKRGLLAFRNANVVGQYDSTRARGFINTITSKINAEADKYRRSRVALHSLENISSLDEYPELKDEDIVLEAVEDPDLLALAQLRKSDKRARKTQHLSTGKTTSSWIWTGLGGPTEDETAAVLESSRVEWSKSLARRDRWTEEVNTLREEMKRVLRFLTWQIDWWKASMPPIEHKNLPLPSSAITAGIRAYAFQQMAYLEQIAVSFRQQWRLV